MSPEWEKPVKTVLDFFRRDAVTLMGFSLGGGLVIRAAAFEPRVRRVIAYDWAVIRPTVLSISISGGAPTSTLLVSQQRCRSLCSAAYSSTPNSSKPEP